MASKKKSEEALKAQELYKDVDFKKRVKLVATDLAKNHTPGEEFLAGEVVAKILIERGEAQPA